MKVTKLVDDRMTQHVQASIISLVCGVVLLLGGLFGIYYQGAFWASGVVAAMNPGEDALALGLPAGVTLAGAFLLSYVLLASPLTAHWSSRKRGISFEIFAFGVLAACGIAAWFAGQVAGKKLQRTEAPSNKPVAANHAVFSLVILSRTGKVSVWQRVDLPGVFYFPSNMKLT